MKTFIKLLCIVATFSMNAQNSISGKIVNTQNKALFGVEVYAQELHRGSTSKEDGAFILNNIPNGKIKIVFNYLGFKTTDRTVFLNNKNVKINIELEEAVFTMDEIIVSTPFNKLQSENVMKVDILSANSLKKMGITTLSEGITNIAGVSQISTGNAIGKPVIRGLSGNRVLVYTQGIRLENQQFGGEHGLGVNEAGISSIEVIKGPASLLYGSDALGGVLYLTPEKFAIENDRNITFNQRFYSNTFGTNTSLGLKYSLEKWRFLARTTYANHSDYKTAANKRVTNTRFNEKDYKIGIAYSKNNFTSELRYNFNNSQLGLTEGITQQSTSKTLLEAYQLIDNHILSSHNHIFFGNSKLDIDLGYAFNDRQEFEAHEHEDDHEDDEDVHEESEEAALRLKLETFSYNIKYHFPKFGDLEILTGLQGLKQKNSNFGKEILIPNAKLNDFGGYLTANYVWGKNVLQAGLRFDNRSINTEKHEVTYEDEIHVFNAINKSFNSFTASAGLKTTLFNNVISRINLASGFRAPNLAELTSNGIHHGTNRFELGNENLINEKNFQIDISLEYKTDHFEVFGNGFYNKLDNYIFISPTGTFEDAASVYRYAQDDAKLYGGEFGIHLHPHPLDWLHLESTFETVVGKQKNGDYLPLIPANTWKNIFKTEFNINNWLENGYSTLSLESVFSQKNTSNFETNSGSYNLLNLGFGGDIIIKDYKFSTTLSINNLLDKKYIHHLSRLKSDGILNQGANVVLGINFKI